MGRSIRCSSPSEVKLHGQSSETYKLYSSFPGYVIELISKLGELEFLLAAVKHTWIIKLPIFVAQSLLLSLGGVCRCSNVDDGFVEERKPSANSTNST